MWEYHLILEIIYIYIYIYTILGLHIMFCKFMLQNVKWKCHKIRYDVLVS
jgi:hypothetical protein